MKQLREKTPPTTIDATNADELRIGVIGCGHWGPNHIRVFSEHARSRVVMCADFSEDRLAQMTRRFPAVRTTTSAGDIFDSGDIDAVVIATPTGTHASLAKDAMRSGKHVLVEKPLCTTTAELNQLETCAAETGRMVMVGHVFLFNNGIIRLKQQIASKDLGAIQYLDAVRTNLGPVRGDVGALYDLGTHDISIFNYLVGARPIRVSATGSCISLRGIDDVCFATIEYPGGILAHLHVSWLNPRKVRTLTVVGRKKMAHWDDIDPTGSLRIYDKGFKEPPYYDSLGEFQYLLRSGDVFLPNVGHAEPLVNQANAFIDAVTGQAPCNSGISEARDVIDVLEAAAKSMTLGGIAIELGASGTITRTAALDRTDIESTSLIDTTTAPRAPTLAHPFSDHDTFSPVESI